MSLDAKIENWLIKAAKIRAFERIILDQFSAGNIRGTFHSSFGQELTSVILVDLLEESDFIFGTHRSHAIYLAHSENFEGLASEVMGKVGGSSAGIGGSQHLHYKNFYSNGIQGGMCSIAVGVGYDNNQIAVSVIGDGTLGEGSVYESLNLAKVLKTRTLFLLEDNEIAQSTVSKYQRGGEISDRFKAFGIQYSFVDSNNVAELHLAIKSSLDFIRANSEPAGLHIKSYRLGAHSKGDDNRNKDSIDKLSIQEPLTLSLRDNLKIREIYDEHLKEFAELVHRVNAKEPSRDVCLDYAKIGMRRPEGLISISSRESMKVRESVYLGIKQALIADESILMIGEDIEYLSAGTTKPYNGAFGVTRDLSELFPGRILNAPISESAITGFGIGRSLLGKPTIVEIMFGDFMALIVDVVLQQASKLPSMYGEQVKVPILIRTPSGGRRGYGPTHSQNFENLFMGAPNLLVYCQNIFSSPKHYKELLETNLPSIVFENKELYALEQHSPNIEYFDVKFTTNNNVTLESRYKSSKIAVVTYGFAAKLSIEASQILVKDFEIFTNIFIPQIVSPLNLDFASELLKTTETIYLIEEGDATSGLSGLLLSELQRLGFNLIVKVISGHGIKGASLISETESVLTIDKIVSSISSAN